VSTAIDSMCEFLRKAFKVQSVELSQEQAAAACENLPKRYGVSLEHRGRKIRLVIFASEVFPQFQ